MSSNKLLNIMDFKALETLNVCLIYVSLGLSLGIPGPSLLDLSPLVNESLETTSKVIPVRMLGLTIGTILCGLLGDYIDIRLLITIFGYTSTISIALITQCNTIAKLFVCFFFWGFSVGVAKVCGNILILQRWGLKSPLYTQALYFAFGVGNFIGPLLVEPFLLPFASESNRTVTSLKPHHFQASEVMVGKAYEIVALYTLIVTIAFTVIYCNDRTVRNDLVSDQNANTQTESEHNNHVEKPAIVLIIVTIVMCFTHVSFGMEVTVGTLLPLFAVKSDLHLRKSTAAFVTSLYFGVFTCFRIVVVVLGEVMKPTKWLILELTLIFVGCFTITLLGNESIIFTISVIVIAMGQSAVFPTLLSYLLQHFQLTAKSVYLMYVGGCFGEIIYPTIVTTFIDNDAKIFLCVIDFCCLLLCSLFISFILLVQLFCKNGEKYKF